MFRKNVFLLIVASTFLLACRPAVIPVIPDVFSIPGGSIGIVYSEGSIPAETRYAVIALDPDVNICSGNEFIVRIALNPYMQSSGEVSNGFSWSTEGLNVPEGDYFVYAGFDLDGSGLLDNINEYDLISIWDPTNSNYYDNGRSSVISHTTGGFAVPNYHVSNVFCANIDLYIERGW